MEIFPSNFDAIALGTIGADLDSRPGEGPATVNRLRAPQWLPAERRHYSTGIRLRKARGTARREGRRANLDAPVRLCYNLVAPQPVLRSEQAIFRTTTTGSAWPFSLYSMSLEFWRNLSVVWISIHVFLLCLIPLAIAFLAVQGMKWVLGGAQSGLENLQDASSKARARTEETAAQLTSAVIQGQSKAERSQATLRQLLRRTEPAPPSSPKK